MAARNFGHSSFQTTMSLIVVRSVIPRSIQSRLFLFLMLTVMGSKGQSGLDGILVEKYYITGPGDSLCSDSTGCVPAGSTTYRIYVDMAPVYRLQAIFGIADHELKIATTTRFYNCPVADGISANDIHPNQLTAGYALLDSWLSLGAAALDYQAIPKLTDDTVPSLALSNKHGLLRNNNPEAGIPLVEKDGMRFLKLQPAVNYFNMEQDLRIFEHRYANEVTGLLRTTDGAWASYGGTVGPQPENKVLIAQLTTDGILSFELNIQLAVPGGGTEKFVARNPASGESVHPALLFSSAPGKSAPSVEIRLLSPDSRRSKNASTQIEAVCNDADGSVARVDLFLNGKIIASDDQAPFVFEVPDGNGSGVYMAKAVDNDGYRASSNNLPVSVKENINK